MGTKPKSTLGDIPPPPSSWASGTTTNGELLEWLDQLKEYIRNLSAKTEALLLKYDAFDIIANLTFSQLAHDPENYKESEHPGLSAIVEYATLLCLKHPYNEGTSKFIEAVDITEIEQSIRDIFTATSFLHSVDTRPGPWNSTHDEMDSFRFLTLNNELTVRSPGYPHHQRQLLSELLAPIAEFISDNLGFTIDDVLKIDGLIQEVVDDHLARSGEIARAGKPDVIADIMNRHIDLQKQESIETAASKQKAEQEAEGLIGIWMMSSLGRNILSFSVEELAGKGAIPAERIKALLSYFGLSFGSMPSDYFLPEPVHALRSNPFIEHKGTYMYPAPGSVLWDFRRRIEDSLKPSPSNPIGNGQLWNKYERHRSDYLEKESLRLLSAALSGSTTYRGLKYKVLENEKSVEFELDGLIIYDQTLLLVEAKAGTLTLPARRGARKRLERDLGSLFGEAHLQVLRAKNYIETTQSPSFVNDEGAKVTIDMGQFRRTILIIVSLESLDHFNADLWRLIDAGIIQDENLPWAVSLNVLRVICEINEFSTQLIHYLGRRVRLNDFKKFHAMDELDWFGYYLERGLYFEDNKEVADYDVVTFPSFTDMFDSYYYYEMGLKKTPVPKPTQRMPMIFREIVGDIERQKSTHGYSEAVLGLIDWNEVTRNQVVLQFQNIRTATRRDKNIHNFSLVSDDSKSGITIVSGTSENGQEAFEALEYLVTRRKYTHKADKWLGLLTIIDEQHRVHGIIWADELWQWDAALELLITKHPSKPMKEIRRRRDK